MGLPAPARGGLRRTAPGTSTTRSEYGASVEGVDLEPVWQELRNDARDGATWWDWYCEPPAEGTAYEVTREDTDGYRQGHPVRRILEVRITGGAPLAHCRKDFSLMHPVGECPYDDVTADGGTVSDLADFLATRYDEAEAMARSAAPGPWHFSARGGADDEILSENGTPVVAGGRWGGEASVFDEDADGAFIASVDPAHRLADVALKRAILAEHKPRMLGRWQVCGTCRPVDPEHPDDLTSVPWPCKTVRQLGTEFACHPAYREAWKP